MSVSTSYRLKGKAGDSYLELVDTIPLASIQSERHFWAAQRVIDGLFNRAEGDAGAALYLDALSDLIAAYEDSHYPVPAPSAADMIRCLLEARGVTQAEVCRDTGIAKSSISQVLSGKRPLSRLMIRALADYFQIDASVLAANFG